MNKKLALSLVLIVASLLIFSMPTWAVEVNVDIKPEGCPNPLNVKSKGVIPVAILGTADFDVEDIDITSVLLEGAPALRSSIEDVGTPFNGAIDFNCFACTEDGPDGFLDLTLKFDTQDIVEAVEAVGAVGDGDCVDLNLTGQLLDGTPIEGADNVIILQKGNGRP